MKTKEVSTIKVETTVQQSIEKVWEYFTQPEHITRWNFATDEWHCPAATNDLKPGGKFSWRMEAKDGSMGFDFSGTYKEIVPHEKIYYVLDDDRKVSVEFSTLNGKSKVTEFFEAESSNPAEMQQSGWQAILDNFRKYAEEGK